MRTLRSILSAVTPADQTAMEAARARWDSIAKPLRGLGKLEDLLVRAAGAAGDPELDFSNMQVGPETLAQLVICICICICIWVPHLHEHGYIALKATTMPHGGSNTAIRYSRSHSQIYSSL